MDDKKLYERTKRYLKELTGMGQTGNEILIMEALAWLIEREVARGGADHQERGVALFEVLRVHCENLSGQSKSTKI